MRKFASKMDGRMIYVPQGDFDVALLASGSMPRYSDLVTVKGSDKKGSKIRAFATAIEKHLDEAIRRYEANEASGQTIVREFQSVRI